MSTGDQQLSPPRMTVGTVFAALAFMALLVAGPWYFFHTHPLPVSTIVIATPDVERVFSTISPYGRGLEREIIEEFLEKNGWRAKWLKTRTLEDGWQALLDGRAHIFIGLGYRPESIPRGAPITVGSVYERHQPVLLAHSSQPMLKFNPDPCTTQVLVQGLPALARSLKHSDLTEACDPQFAFSETSRIAPILESQSANATIPYTLVDEGAYLPWRSFYPRLRPAARLEEEIGYRWYWRTDVPKLDEKLLKLFRDDLFTGRLEKLQEKYYGFFPEQAEFGRIWLLKKTIQVRAKRYKELIISAAREFGLDPLMLVSVIQQESGFNPAAVSYTGVQGLMQLTMATARALGATNRNDPAQSIRFGAKYLKRLWKRLGPMELEHWDRWAMAMAAYNQGIGHVYDAMYLAKRMELDPKSWAALKQILPLKEREVYHRKTMFGHSRGLEGVEYVNRIRHYYYLLKGLSLISGDQRDQLAPFVLHIRDFGL